MLMVLYIFINVIIAIAIVEYTIYTVKTKTNGTYIDWMVQIIASLIITTLIYIFVLG